MEKELELTDASIASLCAGLMSDADDRKSWPDFASLTFCRRTAEFFLPLK